MAKGNTDEQNASRTQGRTHDVPSALDRVREAARKDGKAKFTALLHHVTPDRLREAFFASLLDPERGGGRPIQFHRFPLFYHP